MRRGTARLVSGQVSFALKLGGVLTLVLRRGRNGAIGCSLPRQNLLEFCSERIRGDGHLLRRSKYDRTSQEPSSPLAMALDFTHCSGGIRVAQQGWNLGTASYATISGSGNSVTFETQRLIPASVTDNDQRLTHGISHMLRKSCSRTACHKPCPTHPPLPASSHLPGRSPSVHSNAAPTTG